MLVRFRIVKPTRRDPFTNGSELSGIDAVDGSSPRREGAIKRAADEAP
jgi:hypothetical protein